VNEYHHSVIMLKRLKYMQIIEIVEYHSIKKDINMEIDGGSCIYFSRANLLKARVINKL